MTGITNSEQVLLGRYHAREVILGELWRRRTEAADVLKAAKKEMKKIVADVPDDDATETDRQHYYARIGEQKLQIDKLEAAKASAEAALTTHISSKGLPLFNAEPEQVAADCISGGITLLFEQNMDHDEIRGLVEHELFVASHRFAVDKALVDNRENEAQQALFDTPLPRDETERSLAFLLGTSLPRPNSFAWIEVIAHFSDDDLAAAWAWALQPHRIDQPECITNILAGKLDDIEHDPRLPCSISAKAEARLLHGLSAVDIDDTGRVTVYPVNGPAQEVGRILPSQVVIPVWAGLRLVRAADPRWSETTRADWTWKAREDAAAAVRLPPRKDAANAPAATEAPQEAAKPNGNSLADIPVEDIRAAMVAKKGNLTEAGDMLGISRDALRRRCAFYGLKAEDFR